MKKIIIFVFYFLLSTFLSALGTLRVESIKMLPETSMNIEVHDADGKYAPVLIVKTDLKGLGFQNVSRPTIHSAEYIDGDHHYKFYMNDNQRVIKITHSDYEPLEIRLLADFGINIKSQRVYELRLEYQGSYMQIKDKGIGNLSITTNPSGAQVKIIEYPDFNRHTPCELNNYPAITYNFVISKDRYVLIDTTISIKKNEKKTVNLKLEPLWGDLSVVSNPVESEVFIDSKFFGKTPLLLEGEKNGLNIGEHHLKITKDKYYSYQTNIQVDKEKLNNQQILLSPRLGSLIITSEPNNSNIKIDGDTKGYTPMKISNLLVGSHEIEISAEDFGTIQNIIQIQENRTLDVNVKLDKTQQITITSKPSNADIYINGNNVGSTPYKAKIALSKHKIGIYHYGYFPVHKTLNVKTSKFEYSFKLVKTVDSHFAILYGADAIAVEYGSSLYSRLLTFGVSYVIPDKVPKYVDHVNIHQFPDIDPLSTKVGSYDSGGMDFYLKKGFLYSYYINLIINVGIGYRFRIENAIYQSNENADLWECEIGDYWTSYWESGYGYGKINNYFPLIIGLSLPLKGNILLSIDYWTTFGKMNNLVFGLGLYY